MDTNTVITKWVIDPGHSNIEFRVKHLVISTVTGKFNKFEGSVEQEGEGLENASVEFAAEVASIDTGVADRDAHLRSDDFFNAETYPQLTFRSTRIEKAGEDRYRMTGDLTIREVTKPVALDVVHGGTVTDPYGNTRAGYEISGTISRKDFNLRWNAVTEAGSVVVSDAVRLELNVQVVAQA